MHLQTYHNLENCTTKLYAYNLAYRMCRTLICSCMQRLYSNTQYILRLIVYKYICEAAKMKATITLLMEDAHVSALKVSAVQAAKRLTAVSEHICIYTCDTHVCMHIIEKISYLYCF